MAVVIHCTPSPTPRIIIKLRLVPPYSSLTSRFMRSQSSFWIGSLNAKIPGILALFLSKKFVFHFCAAMSPVATTASASMGDKPTNELSG
jgi:hypothetical protein